MKSDIPLRATAFSKPQPFINSQAKPGINQLLTKAKKAAPGGALTLSLNKKQAIGLMDQLDLWGYDQFRLPDQYLAAIPQYGPSGVFRSISMEIETAIDQSDRSAKRSRQP